VNDGTHEAAASLTVLAAEVIAAASAMQTDS
jgi:hypothetical protein